MGREWRAGLIDVVRITVTQKPRVDVPEETKFLISFHAGSQA